MFGCGASLATRVRRRPLAFSLALAMTAPLRNSVD
jgi:hypothetical protein